MVLAGKSRSVLEMLLTMEDKSSKELKKVDSNLGKVDKAARKSSQGIKGMNTDLLKMGAGAGVALAGTIALAKGLYDLGGRGAAVQQTEQSFDGLLEKLDVAPDLLDKQRAAVRGTVDDMTLMASTQTLLAGTTDEVGKELAEATPKLLEIAKAANKLNPSLGDTAFLYESITAGIKRGSPLVLDNLGIVTKLGEAQADYADKLGITVEELTAEQKTLALLNDVSERAGDILIEQAGGAAAVGDEYAELEAATKNLKDELSKLVNTGLKPIIPVLADVATEANKGVSAWGEINQALADGTLERDRYLEWVKDYLFYGATQSELLDEINQRTDIATEVTTQLGNQTGWAAGQMRMLATEEEIAAQQAEYLKQTQIELRSEISELQGLISGRLGPELEQFTEKNVNLQTEAAGLRETISGLKGEEYLSEEQEQELATLEGKLGEVNSAIKENVLEHEKAQKAIVFSLLQQQAAADGYTEDEVSGLLQVAEHWGIIDEETRIATENISGALAQLTEDGNLENFQQAMDDTLYRVGEDTDAMEVEIKDLKSELLLLEGDYHVNIIVSQTGKVPNAPSGLDAEKSGIGGQHGLDMVVPKGFREPDNPFWIGASSGEEVKVTPRGQRDKGGEATIVNIHNPQINSEIDIDNMARQVAEAIREKGK